MTRQEQAYYNNYLRLYKGLTKKYTPIVKATMQAMVNSYLSNYNGITMDVALPVDVMKQTLLRLYKNVGTVFALDTKRYLGRVTKGATDDADVWAKAVEIYLKQHGLDKLSVEITDSLKNEIIKTLQDAHANGWGVDKTVRYLQDAPFLKWQAERIVRTEMGKAANVGKFFAGVGSGLDMNKRWLSAGDNRTRRIPRNKYDHLFMGGKEVGFFERFIIPSTQAVEGLLFPCDPIGQPGDVINCRCTYVLIPKRDKDGNLIENNFDNNNPFSLILHQAMLEILGTALHG